MDITKLTRGQAEALIHSLKAQKSPKTTAEKRHLNQLMELYAHKVAIDSHGIVAIRYKDFIKLINLDTCGDDWRVRWLKIRGTIKGEYFQCAYLDNKRVYLD